MNIHSRTTLLGTPVQLKIMVPVFVKLLEINKLIYVFIIEFIFTVKLDQIFLQAGHID